MRLSAGWALLLGAALTSQGQEPYVSCTDQLVTEVHVNDLGRSIEFYESLGFELVRRDETFAELSWETSLLFLDSHRKPPPAPTPGANVRVMVRDVDAVWTLVQERGIRVVRPIEDRYYGLRDFSIADPDGFGIRFATRLAE